MLWRCNKSAQIPHNERHRPNCGTPTCNNRPEIETIAVRWVLTRFPAKSVPSSNLKAHRRCILYVVSLRPLHPGVAVALRLRTSREVDHDPIPAHDGRRSSRLLVTSTERAVQDRQSSWHVRLRKRVSPSARNQRSMGGRICMRPAADLERAVRRPSGDRAIARGPVQSAIVDRGLICRFPAIASDATSSFHPALAAAAARRSLNVDEATQLSEATARPGNASRRVSSRPTARAFVAAPLDRRTIL